MILSKSFFVISDFLKGLRSSVVCSSAWRTSFCISLIDFVEATDAADGIRCILRLDSPFLNITSGSEVTVGAITNTACSAKDINPAIIKFFLYIFRD